MGKRKTIQILVGKLKHMFKIFTSSRFEYGSKLEPEFDLVQVLESTEGVDLLTSRT